MGQFEAWDEHKEDYNDNIRQPPRNLPPGASPFRTGPEYKLYVNPVHDEYDEKSLERIFSPFGDVLEVYISEKKETGFRWGFVYFNNRASADAAIENLNENEKYGFKVKFAKEKSKPVQVKEQNRVNNTYVAPSDKSAIISGATNPVSSALSNSVAYFTPPNCKTCKKLTAFTCSSCRNPFCNTACSLDGWKYHTGECIKIANLMHSSEVAGNGFTAVSNGTGSHISETVITFMRQIREKNENFKTEDFAAVCSGVTKPIPKLMDPSDNQYKCDAEPSSPPRRKSFSNSYTKFTAKPGIASNNITSVKPPDKSYDGYSQREEVKSLNGRVLMDNHVNFKPKNGSDKAAPFGARNNVRDGNADTFSKPFRATNSQHSKSTAAKEKKEIHLGTDFKLEAGKHVPAFVTVIENDDTFYIVDPEKFFSFIEKMKKENIAELPMLENRNLYTLCFGFYDDDWYRAQIISEEPLEVLYIDFGNKETVDKSILKLMPSRYRKPPPLACKVKLLNGTVRSKGVERDEQLVVQPVEYNEKTKEWIVDTF